ncbi:MAG: protein kinase [Pseudanabaena sp. ELA645]|jgi:serine/threonine-protein kinase
MNGQLLADRYKIINVLGAGGMGQTYVAEDTQRPNNPKCVVKQLKPVSPDPNFLVTARRLFTGEAEMLDKLGDHDQIPRLFAYFERDGEFYLVQEWIDGQPLSAELS